MNSFVDASRSRRALLIAMFALGASIAVHGTMSLPADGHEALVVETAQEMRDRGVWIVPYYNHELRLAKPPLNYWLTRITAAAAGTPDRIEPWHARLTSVISGLALLAVIFFVAARLFDVPTAFIAAALAVSSTAFFSGTHDGRSDMLYTLCCGTGIAGFVHAWSTPGKRSERIGIYGMWAAFGVATLTKGPHLPLMFLAAIVLFCLLRLPRRAQVFQRLRLLSGAALGASLCVPWWIAVRHNVGAEVLRNSQLAGSLLHARWDKALDPYYLYTPFVYVLPWVTLLPALIWLLRRREQRSDGALLLTLLYVVPVLALTCGPQKRLVYALPVWVPLVILLAAAAVAYVRHATPEVLRKTQRWFLPAHATIAAGVAAAIALAPESSTSARVVAAAALSGGCWITRRCVRSASEPREPLRDLLVATLLVGMVFAAAGGSTMFFEKTRYEKVRLAGVINDIGAEEPLAALALNASPYVYYTRRPIAELATVEDVAAWLANETSGEGLVLAATALVPTLRDAVASEVLSGFSDPDDATTLVRVRRTSGLSPVSEQPK